MLDVMNEVAVESCTNDCYICIDIRKYYDKLVDRKPFLRRQGVEAKLFSVWWNHLANIKNYTNAGKSRRIINNIKDVTLYKR